MSSFTSKIVCEIVSFFYEKNKGYRIVKGSVERCKGILIG